MFRSRVVSVFLTILLLTSATVVFGVTLPSTKLDLGEANGLTGGIAFSPDGRWMATGLRFDKGVCCYQYKIAIWDVRMGKMHTLIDETYGASFAFTPDGRMLVTGSLDSSVVLWDTNNWEQTATLKQPSAKARRLAISPDSQFLVVANAGDDVREDTVSVWDIDTRELVDTIGNYGGGSLVFMGQSNVLAVRRNSGIELLDMDHALPNTPTFIEPWNFVISPDDQFIIFRWDEEINFWSVEKRVVVAVLEEDSQWEWGLGPIAISGNGRLFASSLTDDEQLTIWDMETREPVVIVNKKIDCMAFSPDGKWLATGNAADGEIVLMDVSSFGGGGNPDLPPSDQAVDSEGKLVTTWGAVKSK